MAFRFFSIPIQGCRQTERELNSFLRSHSIVSVDRRFVDQGIASVWSLCVDYAEPGGGEVANANRGALPRSRVDYREVLSAEQFAAFSKLRDARKKISQSEGTPVYTVFTNEQLAQMVQQQVGSKADLERIVGVGDSRVEKYGERILQALAALPTIDDETTRKSH
jgi:superfamily II DNA helicase RecQ